MKKQLRDFFYALLNAPNYPLYLEHFKKRHPNKEPLSKKEFYLEHINKKNIKC